MKIELVEVTKGGRKVKINLSQIAEYKDKGWSLNKPKPEIETAEAEMEPASGVGDRVWWIEEGEKLQGEFRKLDDNDDSLARIRVDGKKSLISVPLADLKVTNQ